jgi:vitamin K-dependent gamma-carboxylase
MPLIRLLHRLVTLRADARLLALARIVTGVNAVAAAWEAWRVLSGIFAPLAVKLPYFTWIPNPPRAALPIFIGVWLIAAVAFALGWGTRLAGVALSCLTAFTLILDQQTYSNHFYLLVIIVVLLTIADSGAAWSVDAHRRGQRLDVPAWPVLLMKAQASMVYFFSALAKITPQYLSGDILMQSLKVPWWGGPRAMSVVAVLSIASELFVACALWSSRVRVFAVVVGVGFHTLILLFLDSSRLALSIFALDMFAVYVVFFDARSGAQVPTSSQATDRQRPNANVP